MSASKPPGGRYFEHTLNAFCLSPITVTWRTLRFVHTLDNIARFSGKPARRRFGSQCTPRSAGRLAPISIQNKHTETHRHRLRLTTNFDREAQAFVVAELFRHACKTMQTFTASYNEQIVYHSPSALTDIGRPDLVCVHKNKRVQWIAEGWIKHYAVHKVTNTRSKRKHWTRRC